MVDVYVAGLYVEAKSSDPGTLLSADQSKQLVMRFVRSVGKEKLAEAWTEGFDKNAGDLRTALAPSLAKLNAAMADVKKEDRITLTYVPEAGVTVTVKGNDAAVIPGDDFQRVLFSIWLGAQTAQRVPPRRPPGSLSNELREHFPFSGKAPRIPLCGEKGKCSLSSSEATDVVEDGLRLVVFGIQFEHALGGAARFVEAARGARQPGDRQLRLGNRRIEPAARR